MIKRIFRVSTTLAMFASTSAIAANAPAPASMKQGYENQFKWIKTTEPVQPYSMQTPVATTTTTTTSTATTTYVQPPVAQQPLSLKQPPVTGQTPAQQAVSDVGDVVVSGKLTTLGEGAEVGTMFNDNLGGRLNMQYANVKSDYTASGIKYKGDLDWFTTGALLDYYPSDESGFRLSGGGYFGNNDVSIHGTPTNNVDIGGTTYTPGQIGTISGKVKPNYVAPYLGLGYSSLRHDWDNWRASIDAGVKYNGDPDVHLSTTNPTVTQADLRREENNVEDDLNLTKFYPVVGVTVGYKF